MSLLKSDVYDFIEEIECWGIIGKGVPPAYTEFAQKALNLKLSYRNVTVAIKNYNVMLAGNRFIYLKKPHNYKKTEKIHFFQP